MVVVDVAAICYSLFFCLRREFFLFFFSAAFTSSLFSPLLATSFATTSDDDDGISAACCITAADDAFSTVDFCSEGGVLATGGFSCTTTAAATVATGFCFNYGSAGVEVVFVVSTTVLVLLSVADVAGGVAFGAG